MTAVKKLYYEDDAVSCYCWPLVACSKDSHLQNIPPFKLTEKSSLASGVIFGHGGWRWQRDQILKEKVSTILARCAFRNFSTIFQFYVKSSLKMLDSKYCFKLSHMIMWLCQPRCRDTTNLIYSSQNWSLDIHSPLLSLCYTNIWTFYQVQTIIHYIDV